MVKALSKLFDQDKPIYLQVREKIEDQIVNNQLHEGNKHLQQTSLLVFIKLITQPYQRGSIN